MGWTKWALSSLPGRFVADSIREMRIEELLDAFKEMIATYVSALNQCPY